MRPSGALRAITVKVERAKEHLATLNVEIDTFASQRPYAVHVVTYAGTNEIQDFVWVRDTPGRWSAITGDCVHNLRSALDHIVWALSGGDDTAPPRSEFPIFLEEDRYLQRSARGEPARGSGLQKIEGVRPFEAKTKIRQLQPFRSPKPAEHPLWILHELDNFDKHRALHVVMGWGYTELWRRGINDVTDLPPGWRQLRATQGHAYPRPGATSRVKLRSDLAMRVALEDTVVGTTNNNVDVVLTELISYVEQTVLSTLEPYLP